MKTNFLISPVGSQKVGRGKENSKTLSRMTEIPSVGKRTHKDPQSIPNKQKVSKASLSGSEVTKETPP